MNKNEIAVKDEKNFVVPTSSLEIDTEDLDGLTISFDKISIPSGGGQMWELPGADNPDEPILQLYINNTNLFKIKCKRDDKK